MILSKKATDNLIVVFKGADPSLAEVIKIQSEPGDQSGTRRRVFRSRISERSYSKAKSLVILAEKKIEFICSIFRGRVAPTVALNTQVKSDI
jgi:hypothetical protein